MYQEYTLGVAITFISSLAAIAVLGKVSLVHKTKRLSLLLASVLLLNCIWYSTLIFYYFKPLFPGPTGPNKIFWFEFAMLSIIFLIRFGMLVALLTLIRYILGLSVSKKLLSLVRGSVLMLSILWFAGWTEIPWLGSRHVVDQLMVLTDFMIFITVIAAAIYLQYRAGFVPHIEYKMAIKTLGGIIIFPLVMGSLKLVIGSSLGEIAGVLERSMIYLTLVAFNVLIIWWAVKYASSVAKYDDFILSLEKIDPDNFMTKYAITRREMEVIELIRQGKTNKEIADRLFISVETVKDHNYKIFQKTGVKNRIQLVNLVNIPPRDS